MLEDLALPSRTRTCKVRTVKNELSEKDALVLESAVMNPEWPCKTLSNELAKRGTQLGDMSIKNHREKRCSCWKT
jgi:hypothetical protein